MNLRTEPKHIVFLNQLLLLFKFCYVCKTENPELEAKQVGTEAVVTTSCSNPKCPKQVNTWHSQTVMPNSQIPAGNFLLCMAVLLAGSSATKVFQVFKHMGLSCVSLNTYFKCQRVSFFQFSSCWIFCCVPIYERWLEIYLTWSLTGQGVSKQFSLLTGSLPSKRNWTHVYFFKNQKQSHKISLHTINTK